MNSTTNPEKIPTSSRAICLPFHWVWRTVAPWKPRYCIRIDAGRLRSGVQGAAAPPAPRPGTSSLGTLIRCSFVPSAWRACPLVRMGAVIRICKLWHTKGMRRCIYSELTSFAGGLGGGSPTQRGARGAEPARRRESAAAAWAAGSARAKPPRKVVILRSSELRCDLHCDTLY